nr:hypothetical protein [Tanacetum cinerariifolium]
LEAGIAAKSGEVAGLNGKNFELLGKVSGLKSTREELDSQVSKQKVDCEVLRNEETSVELDAHIPDVRRDIDNDLYPHMFIAIAERRWVLSHDVCRVVMKCAQFVECQSALGKVTILVYPESGSVIHEIPLSEVISAVCVAAERSGLCLPFSSASGRGAIAALLQDF